MTPEQTLAADPDNIMDPENVFHPLAVNNMSGSASTDDSKNSTSPGLTFMVNISLSNIEKFNTIIFQSSFSSNPSYISMRSDQTWNGNPVYGTLPEMLARDEWILLQMSQYGTPMINVTVRNSH